MKVQDFLRSLETIKIANYIGVPDSTLKPLCDYWNSHLDHYHHVVTVNEGAAVALGAGRYIGGDELSCIYMQNSGLGNALNPLVSLIHEKVYDIPMLFVIGYRGEVGTKDEPQHVFQGEITLPLLDLLGIEYDVLSEDTSSDTWQAIVKRVHTALSHHHQYALVIKKNTFAKEAACGYDNGYTLRREDAIHELLSQIHERDLLVTTTGKISREAYEQSDLLYHHHKQLFLTVGSMGHASMIAQGIAQCNPSRRVICVDGDGAALMHMGSMNYIAKQPCDNLLHIILNNGAHESVGGMPTDCVDTDFAQAAQAFGYRHVYQVSTRLDLIDTLHEIDDQRGPILLEVKVALGARDDLGRPKESAKANKEAFMEYRKGSETK